MQTATDYKSLFRKIQSLAGKEKKEFCRKLTKDEKEAYVNHLKEKDTEMVTGVFRCFQPVGGSVTMSAKAYADEEPTKYTFIDGQEYTVPRYVARRLENEFMGSGTWYPTHSYILDKDGKPTVQVGKKNHRFGFSSLDFR